MPNNFDVEVKSLAVLPNITDRLMALALYYELYNETVNILDKFNHDAAIFYGQYLTTSMKDCLSSMKSETQPVDYKKFVQLYISSIEQNTLSTVHPVREKIREVKENVGSCEERYQLAKTIEFYEHNFDVAADDIKVISNHIYQVSRSFSDLYGEKESKSISDEVVKELIEQMPEIIVSKSSQGELSELLKVKTQSIVFNKMINSGFDFGTYKDQKLLRSLDAQEKKIFMYSQIFALSGYSVIDAAKFTDDEMDAARKLNMTLFEYKDKVTSLNIKLLKTWMFNGNTPRSANAEQTSDAANSIKKYHLTVKSNKQ